MKKFSEVGGTYTFTLNVMAFSQVCAGVQAHQTVHVKHEQSVVHN